MKEHYFEITKECPHYDIEDKAWCCLAKFGSELTNTVKRFFPDIPIDIQEHRGKDLYKGV